MLKLPESSKCPTALSVIIAFEPLGCVLEIHRRRSEVILCQSTNASTLSKIVWRLNTSTSSSAMNASDSGVASPSEATSISSTERSSTPRQEFQCFAASIAGVDYRYSHSVSLRTLIAASLTMSTIPTIRLRHRLWWVFQDNRHRHHHRRHLLWSRRCILKVRQRI